MNNNPNLIHQVRKQQRKLICIRVVLSIEGANNFKIDYTTDMILGGLLIHTPAPLQNGTRLDILF